LARAQGGAQVRAVTGGSCMWYITSSTELGRGRYSAHTHCLSWLFRMCFPWRL